MDNPRVVRQFSSSMVQTPLSGRGFYGVPQNDATIIKLLINGSATDINGTIVGCVDFNNLEDNTLNETTLIIYGMFVIL